MNALAWLAICAWVTTWVWSAKIGLGGISLTKATRAAARTRVLLPRKTKTSYSSKVATSLGQNTKVLARCLVGVVKTQIRHRGRIRKRSSPRLQIEDRTLGILVSFAGATLLVDPRLSVVVVLLGLILSMTHPLLVKRRRQTSDRSACEGGLAPLIDVVRACVASGILPRDALVALHRNVVVDSLAFFQPHLAAVASRSESGMSFVESVDGLKEAGPGVVAFVASLQAGERYGIPIGPTLDSLAIDARSANRRRLEARARRLPIALLFPLVVCILPAFALLTVVPLLLSGLSSVTF